MSNLDNYAEWALEVKGNSGPLAKRLAAQEASASVQNYLQNVTKWIEKVNEPLPEKTRELLNPVLEAMDDRKTADHEENGGVDRTRSAVA